MRPDSVLVGTLRQSGLLERHAQDGLFGAVGILHTLIASSAVGEDHVQADWLRVRGEIQECEIFSESSDNLLCCFTRKLIQTIEVVLLVPCRLNMKHQQQSGMRRR